MSKLIPLSFAVALVAGFALAAPQEPAPDFAPDALTSWLPVGDDYLPPPSGPGPVTFDPAHRYVPNFTGEQPTYRVADLTNPILQPWAAEQMRAANEAVLAGKVPFRARESCWPAGVPTFLVYALATRLFFLQTPREVTLIYQGGAERRHVYLNVPHSPAPAPSWYGESVGHYEGDTLVVDTIGLNTRSFVDNYRTPHTSQLHVVERYRLTGAGQALEVAFRVEDAGAFTTSWSGMQRFRRQSQALGEQPCVESDVRYFGYETYPAPVASRPDF